VTSRHDPNLLPVDLPVPVDDGAADHLPGVRLPPLTFEATTGGPLELRELAAGILVLYVYPRTGRPGIDPPAGWDEIPGARGCTPQSCAFRDHHAEFGAFGARVAGLSSQTSEYQREAAERLGLPFRLLADPELLLAAALDLPTFTVEGMRLYRRLTIVARAGTIAKVFYPVFPPDRNAEEVLAWLSMNTVAVIGLGGMGSRIARRLLAGHRVVVWNRTPAKVAELVELGAMPAECRMAAGATATMRRSSPGYSGPR
jgi:peroxiredoxin